MAAVITPMGCGVRVEQPDQAAPLPAQQAAPLPAQQAVPPQPPPVPGTDVQITFPGETTLLNDAEILGQPAGPYFPSAVPALCYADRPTGLAYAARGWTVEESSFHFHNDAELAANAVELAARSVKDGKPGSTTPLLTKGYRSAQVVVTMESRRVHVIRGVVCGRAVVVASVSGADLNPADERVVRFFDSINPPEARVPGWKPVAPPTREEFRPYAWILPAFGVAFAPSRNAVYIREVPPGGDWKPGWKTDPKHAVADHAGLTKFAWYDAGPLVRYQYPSFRREAEVKVEKSHGCVVNDAANQLYVLRYVNLPGNGRYEADPHVLLIYDLGPPNAPHPEPVLVKEVPAPRQSTPPLVSPDGRYAYWLAWGRESGKAIAMRLDTKTLTVKELPLDNHYRTMCLAPGGRTLVVASYFESGAWNKPPVGAELDPETWQVRRTFKLAKSPHSLVVTDDRRLVYVTWSSTHHDTGRVAVLNLNDAEPAERYLERPPGKAGLMLSPDGQRLFLSPGVWPHSWKFTTISSGAEAAVWDATEAGNGRVRVLGKIHSSRADRIVIGDATYISPDGKCLVFHSGRICWLGDGPVPEVDDAARWKP